MTPTNSANNTTYAFGPFSIDETERQLRRDGDAVPLPPKAVDLLLALIEMPGRVRTREELLDRVWPDTAVEESNLSQNIFILRKALDDDRDRWIATVPRRGYRFAGEVQRRAETDAAPRGTVIEVRRPLPRRYQIAAVIIAVVLVAAAIIFGLEYASSTSKTSDRPRPIAVLPFRDVDDRHRDRALELGIADTLINKLSRLPQLIVSPTRAISGFVEKPEDARTAGRALGVEAVIEGNLQRDGNRIRSTVRMVNDHQRRIRRAVIPIAALSLAAHAHAIRRADSFVQLLRIVDTAVRKIRGIGELYCYDAALRLGAYLRIAPDRVSLHAGTRKGARALLRNQSQ
jgi:DNA-binding winged helix-turn-helix (wHTH) protein/TolB-like protein